MNTEWRKINTFIVISIDQFISLGVINKLAQFICQICDSEFKSYNKNAKYCSQSCKGKAYIKHSVKECLICSKEYKPIRATSKFCSLKCCAADKKNRVVLLPLFLSAQYTNFVSILEFIER
ncbi:hypothetical protein ABE039_21885 [Priestia megaterium]|jgi:hypothetical protein